MEITFSSAVLIGRTLPKWRLKWFGVCTAPQAYQDKAVLAEGPEHRGAHLVWRQSARAAAGAGVQGCGRTCALCQMREKNSKDKIPLSLRGSSTVEFPRKNLSELSFLHVIKFSLVYTSWVILNWNDWRSGKTFQSYSGLTGFKHPSS